MQIPFNIDILSLPCISDNRGRERTIISYPKISGIYKITSPNGSIYIGLSTDIYYRIYNYKKLRCKAQHKIYNSLLKYGIENHKFEIIHVVNDKEKSEIVKCIGELEIEYIKKFNSFYGDNDYGLNLTRGGNMVILTNETKKIITQKKIGRIVSIETKNKLRLAKIGKKLSQEHKDKIRKSNTGKIVSEETKIKLSLSHKGEKHSLERIQKKIGLKQKEETIKKRVDKISGDNHWTKISGGHSEETKLKISNTLKGKFIGNKNPAFGKSLSIETKNKISIKKKGVKRSIESRLKQSKSISGSNHHNFGKKASPELIKKFSESHKLKKQY